MESICIYYPENSICNCIYNKVFVFIMYLDPSLHELRVFVYVSVYAGTVFFLVSRERYRLKLVAYWLP